MAKRRREEAPRAEWQHMVDVREIARVPFEVSIEASEDERRALAIRAGVISIESLKADMTLARDQGDLVLHVTGKITADVTQKCILSAEKVNNKIEEDFEAWFADPEQALSFTKAKREKDLEKGPVDLPVLGEHEDPEPIINGEIDAGELAAQYLCLAIDPYPQAPGAVYEGPKAEQLSEPAAESRKNPFAALKDWKARHNREKT
jgi:uncharacterized metal-binding protein YceD (DUF177 family)